MDLWNVNELRYLVYYVGGSFVLGIILLFFGISLLSTLQVCFGLIYVLFIPGYLAVLCLFEKKEIDIIERIALSFALSIAIVTLVIIVTNNVFKIFFTGFSNFIIISLIIIVLLLIKSYLNNKKI